MRDDYQRLLDIREGIERIEKYTVGGRSEFDGNELVQTWVLHHLQIIGEAARSLSNECKTKQPEIPWEKISGMRNILVHQYFGIDTEIVWAVVEKELPPLGYDGHTVAVLTLESTQVRPLRASDIPHARELVSR